jgi:hypothetical protein
MADRALSASRVEVEEQTRLVIETLEALRPGACDELLHETCTVLSGWDELTLRYVPASETSASCSVAGAYIWDETPPVLAVARASSPGREAFTALHELGHHIQQSDDVLGDGLADAGDRGQVLEEAVCDAFAAAVLLPDHLVKQHIPAAGPSVLDVAALHRASDASRAAVCVRAAQQLTSPGHVLLLDYDGTVQFGASRGLPPLARGSYQGGVPVVLDVLGSARGSRYGRTQFLYRGDVRGEELFVQAGELDGRIVAVAMLDRPPWEERYTPPPREVGPQAGNWICENAGCGQEFDAFDAPCPRCRIPECPECGLCRCAPVVKEQKCTSCNTVYPARFFDPGSAVCQECA